MRSARVLIVCLLLVLLPLRGVLAAQLMGCGDVAPVAEMHHGGEHAGHQVDEPADHGASPCKLCAPCCLAAAPPPVALLNLAPATPAARAPQAPAESWAGVVPPLPDPPPRR